MICVTHSASQEPILMLIRVYASPALQAVSAAVPVWFVHPVTSTTTSDLTNCAILLATLGVMAILRQPGAKHVPTIATHAIRLAVVCLATPLMILGQWITQHQDVFPSQDTMMTRYQLYAFNVRLAALSVQTTPTALLALLTPTWEQTTSATLLAYLISSQIELAWLVTHAPMTATPAVVLDIVCPATIPLISGSWTVVLQGVFQ